MRDKIKLAIVTAFPREPASPCGGVEAVSVNLVRALSALQNLDVHVVTHDATVDALSREEWAGAVIHRLPRSNLPELLDALGPGRRAIKKYLRQLAPQVVHAHDIYGLMTMHLAIPRVFTIHGFIHADTHLSGTRFAGLRAALWRIVETAGWSAQPHIISISPYVRERLASIPHGVIHDIDNPISPSFFSTPRREQIGTIFSAAALIHRKNPIVLIEALAQVRAAGVDASLRLAGTAPDKAYHNKLKQRAQELGMLAHVAFLGRLSSEEIRAELAQASIFALTSFEEGAPMGIEEAMAVGIPVVTSNRCGMPYMVRDGESGFLVNPQDPDDVARRLVALLRDAPLRAAMSGKAREIALDRFHPEAVARRTCAVYHSVLGSAEREEQPSLEILGET